MTGGKWTNLGGDRTWISPETELFIPDLTRPSESYQVPPGIDPANYQVTYHRENVVELETTMMLNFLRNDCKAGMSLNKRITELETPDFHLPHEISAAGYELKCTLSASGILPSAIRPAIWNLLQVPGGGDIVVPTRRGTVPISFSGKPQYRRDGDLIYASVPVSQGAYKFGVHADDCLGLMIYLNLTTTQPFMIVRRFNVGSPDKYFDVPSNNPQQHGIVQQVYIDNGTFGGFGEMEHHSTAIIPNICSRVTDTCTTWAFAGPATQLSKLAKELLK